jgi:hypothetical protein
MALSMLPCHGVALLGCRLTRSRLGTGSFAKGLPVGSLLIVVSSFYMIGTTQYLDSQEN